MKTVHDSSRRKRPKTQGSGKAVFEARSGENIHAVRARRRLEVLGHLKDALGAEAVRSLGASSGSGLEVVRRTVERGIPSKAVADLQKELAEFQVPRPSTYVETIASRATRARRDTLTTEEGERLVRVAGVVARTLDVWESEADTAEFLTSPHPMLDGDTPIDRARSEIGARQVEDILAKLDLGLPV